MSHPSRETSHRAPADHATGAASSGPPSQLRAVRSIRAIAVFLGITLAVFAADQALKYFAFNTGYIVGRPVEINTEHPEATVIPRDGVMVVDHVLALTLMVNEGAVFGLGDGFQWLFIVVSVVAAVVLIRLFWVSPANAWLTHLALALILAGDLGNLYDRLLFNSVRDMLVMFPGVHLPFGWRWPTSLNELLPWVTNRGKPDVWPWVFNIADAALMVGVALVLIVTWSNERRMRRQTAESNRG
jgi:signal peptidase II